MFQVEGYTDISTHDVTQVIVTKKVPTVQEARDEAATFPKSWRVKGVGLSSFADGQSTLCGYICFTVCLSSDGNNKGTNEAGIKRLKALLGRVQWQYKQAYCTNFATEAQILDILA